MGKKPNKFIAELHRWERGVLHSVKNLFDTLEDAVEFLTDEDCGNGKVYDHHGRVVHHHRKHHHGDHYA